MAKTSVVLVIIVLVVVVVAATVFVDAVVTVVVDDDDNDDEEKVTFRPIVGRVIPAHCLEILSPAVGFNVTDSYFDEIRTFNDDKVTQHNTVIV